MSTFCGVISKEASQLPESTLEFHHLNLLAEWLKNELIYLHEDFETKSSFIQNQQQKILSNEENIGELHRKLEILHSAMEQLELDIEEYAVNMLQLKRSVDTLERMQSCDCCPLDCPHQQKMLLRMMADLDSNMTTLDTQMAEILDHTQHAKAPESPYDVIAQILDCHNKTLTQLEEKMYIALDRSAIVEQTYSQILSTLREHISSVTSE